MESYNGDSKVSTSKNFSHETPGSGAKKEVYASEKYEVKGYLIKELSIIFCIISNS